MRWPRRVPFFLSIACWLPAVASAQSTAGNVSLDQYQPTPFSDRILRLDGSTVQPFGQYRVGIDVDYALRPLVLIDAQPGIFQAGTDDRHNVVAHAVGGALAASFGLPFRLEAGILVPLTLFQSGETVTGAVAPSVAGVGNVRLGLKARLLDWRGLGAGAAVLVAVPAGMGTLTHESGFGGEGRLFVDYRRGPLAVGARGGFRLRGQQTFYDVPLGNELTFSAGVTWRLATRTTALAELSGVTAANKPFDNAQQSPLEALLGLRQRIGKTWFTLAGGPGLVDGYGSPVFRVVAGFTWANRPPDADGDGVPDDDDRCPTVPEDRDGFEDADGCPDPDNDKDGIPDAADKCPDAAEDKDGFEDADGCPDPDNDKDGIPDASDKCPAQPETVNDFEDDDGCPDETPPPSDKDKDGILDDVDECPEEAEDKDGFEDEDGCPDLDNDKDGIPDAADKCPREPETINGIDDDDGCPDKGQSQVRLGKKEIETLQPIYFDTDRSRVRHAFYNMLGQVASLLKAHTEIGRCGIEGHTDDTGPPEWNKKLSILRAESVIEFLVLRGVDPERLVPIGHGENLPWASNKTEEGRAKNRRVVFHIEGVNPAEEKKQEIRQERRQRIRHQRERQEEQKQEQDQKVDQKVDQKSDRKVDPRATPKSDPKPDQRPTTKPDQKPDQKTTPTPDPKPDPKPDKKPTTKSDQKPDPKTTPKPEQKVDLKSQPKSAEPADESAESTDVPARPDSRRPVRPGRRPPDAGTGMPRTLQELLKLPPR